MSAHSFGGRRAKIVVSMPPKIRMIRLGVLGMTVRSYSARAVEREDSHTMRSGP